MGKPYYFQTEDEKRMAASRLNASGRPVQMVRPMRPASSDSRERWRENAGGKMIGMDQYLENNRKMYTLENVPTVARTPSPKEQITSKDSQMAILKKFGGNKPIQGSAPTPQDIAEMEKAGDLYSSPTAPTSQDIAEMEKAGTADMSPRFSPIEMRKSTLNAWQSGSLEPLIPKGTRWGTSLDDLPGGRRTPQPFSRPMGMGTLSEKARPTAPGASERLAARRAFLMNPKSSETDRRWARKIGGASNTSYGNYD